jgi:YtoQ family protein
MTNGLLERPVVYLAGEIHTGWRTDLASLITERDLDLELVGPVTDHAASDGCGREILGAAGSPFAIDHVSAGINAVRTRSLLDACHVVVARFWGQREYFEWNSAFDAGLAIALGKPLITIHPSELDHPLKEIDRAALAVARTLDEAAHVLDYALADLTVGAATARTGASVA